jgi:hypothetical protein
MSNLFESRNLLFDSSKIFAIKSEEETNYCK